MSGVGECRAVNKSSGERVRRGIIMSIIVGF